MILSQEQYASFQEAAKPLIRWLNENCHPHVHVVVDSTRAELSEGVASLVTEEFLRD